MKTQRAMRRLALLLAIAAGLAVSVCGDDGRHDADDEPQPRDSDDDSHAPGVDDDDNDNNDDNNNDNDDDNDDAAHEVDRFSANGIDYQLIAGGDPGGDGLSLTMDATGRVRVAAVKARQLYLFTRDRAKGWSRQILALWSDNPDLLADPDGKLHLVFQDQRNWRLMYGTDAAGGWSFTPITPTSPLFTGAYPSLALDRHGAAHVVFQNAAGYDLMYATNAGGDWRLRRLFVADTVSERPTIAMDAQDRPHVAYQDYVKGKVFHAVRDGGDWGREEAAATAAPGAESRIALDAAGYAQIAFDGENMAQFARQTAAGWSTQTVDEGWSDAINLVWRPTGAANLSYRRSAGLAGASELRFASNAGGAWVGSVVDRGEGVGWPSDLALAPDGGARLAYHFGAADALLLASADGNAWAREVVHQADLSGYVTGLALDDAGLARLVYYDFRSGQYVQGTEAASGWSFVDLAAPLEIAYRSSWRLAPAGEIQALGMASEFGPLAYARYADGAWTTEEAAPRVFWFAAPALDEAGAMHFICRTRNPREWRYVTNAAGAWIAESMDLLTPPTWPAFAYANGAPRAAFAGEADEQVVYAWRDGHAWSEETAAAADHAYRVEGLAVDANDAPHIIYSVKDFYAGYHVRYLTKRDGDWEVEEIIETDNSTCLFALDEADRVHAVFYDIVGDELTYATNAGGAWTTAVIDEVGESGATIALTLRGAAVHAAYSDESAVWYAVFPQGYVRNPNRE